MQFRKPRIKKLCFIPPKIIFIEVPFRSETRLISIVSKPIKIVVVVLIFVAVIIGFRFKRPS